MKENIKNQILESAEIKNKIVKDGIEQIEKAAEIFINCIKNGGKILWCGNGGSAGDAQHLATELMGGMADHDRKPIPSIALTTDSSFVTAWSNDTAFDYIFSRQIDGIGSSGDVLVAISTSGNSTNVLNAIRSAQLKKIKSVILTGKSQGKMKGMGDVMISVPTNDTQRVQETKRDDKSEAKPLDVERHEHHGHVDLKVRQQFKDYAREGAGGNQPLTITQFLIAAVKLRLRIQLVNGKESDISREFLAQS